MQVNHAHRQLASCQAFSGVMPPTLFTSPLLQYTTPDSHLSGNSTPTSQDIYPDVTSHPTYTSPIIVVPPSFALENHLNSMPLRTPTIQSWQRELRRMRRRNNPADDISSINQFWEFPAQVIFDEIFRSTPAVGTKVYRHNTRSGTGLIGTYQGFVIDETVRRYQHPFPSHEGIYPDESCTGRETSFGKSKKRRVSSSGSPLTIAVSDVVNPDRNDLHPYASLSPPGSKI